MHTDTHSKQEYRDFEKEIIGFQENLSNFQIDAIKRTLKIIETKTNQILKEQIKENVIRSMEWCSQHDIEISHFYKDNEMEKILDLLAKELLTSSALGLYPSRKYLQEQFQPQRKPDVASAGPTPSSQTAQSTSGESHGHDPASESSQTGEETRSGNWEIVRRQQRAYSKGGPYLLL
jgi:hypothetical protein